MLVLSSVLVLFFLFYFLPGAVLVSNSAGDTKKPFDTGALAVLLSLLFAPLTFTLLSRVFPGQDSLLLAGYISFWALALIGIRLWPGVTGWLPDFGGLPKTDKAAVLFAALLTAIVVALRFGIFQGHISQIDDDHFQLTKLTSIATTGLPSLYARQPLYPFTYYDLDFIAPALWVRYTEGAVGIAQAWVVHIGIQTFAVSLFLTRLIYMYADTRKTRLFGLIALHTATGLDVLFLPWLQLQRWQNETGWGQPHLDGWPIDLSWFDGFMQISMPITLYVWVPQHLLGIAVVGLIFYITTTRPYAKAGPSTHRTWPGLMQKGFPHAVAVALLLVALFNTSVFIFLGAVPGLALWHLYELLTAKERIRQLSYLGSTALVALVLVFPDLIDILSKQSYLEFELRSFAFLDIPGIPWLRYPITGFVYLLLEIGILLPLLLWLMMRPPLHIRPLRFWIFTSIGLLIPFIARTPLFNDIAMRGILPAQFAAVMIGCYVLTQWEDQKRRYVTALVAIQFVLSVVTAGAELYYRFTEERPTIPSTSRWIARNTPLKALVFYEQDPATQEFWYRLTEVNYAQRLSYVPISLSDDYLYTPVSENAWRCLPDVNLYDANSLCSIEARIPGAQPVYIKYLSSAPPVNTAFFALAHEDEDGAIYTLSCPNRDEPEYTDPPPWMRGPYHNLTAPLAEIPANHAIAASTHALVDWLQRESHAQRLFTVTPEQEVIPVILRQWQLENQLSLIDGRSSPVWFLLDYSLDAPWNDMIYARIQKTYYVAHPNVARSQWLPCNQRVVLALPSAEDMQVVHRDLMFDERIAVSEWRAITRPQPAGQIVPMDLIWRKHIPSERLNFFVHLLDGQGTLLAQVDPSAADDGAEQLQHTRIGLYLPPELPAGAYQIRLGVYRPEDSQRLVLPNGEDSAHIPLTVTPFEER